MAPLERAAKITLGMVEPEAIGPMDGTGEKD